VAITFPIFIYIFIFAMISSEFSFYDLALWLIITFSFIALANFASFIPLLNRAQALCALGIVLLINVPIALFLGTIDIFQTGFWLLISVLCVYIGYNLLITNNINDNYQFEEDFEKIYPGIISGIGLGILIACIYFSINYDLQNNDYSKFRIYGIILLWSFNALALISLGLYEKGARARKTIKMIVSALPLFLGIFLMYFGIFLFRIEKLIEALIEFFLGFIIIIYGLRRLNGQDLPWLVLTGSITLALVSTLGYLLLL
jgi:hypothetical protein